MTDDRGQNPKPIPDAVRRLYDLVVDYEQRSEAAETELIRAFEAAASALAPAVGELTIDDDDDERLVLTSGGRFSGAVLVTDPAPHWDTLAQPADIVDHYDPVDLFSDLAEVIAEAFPGVESEEGTEPLAAPEDVFGPATIRTATPEAALDQPPVDRAPMSGPAAETAPDPVPPAATEMLRALEDLHSAGVLTDAQFEAQRAKLGK